jgi:DNA-directed RNA polymerase specialized sigma24 family protein
MFHWRRKREAREEAADYATRKDFHRIFTEEMAGLHLLAFLLTADQTKAEQCFVAGLEESIRGNAIFRQWAHSWSKRSIIKNAIKAISPAPGSSGVAAPALATEDGRARSEAPASPAAGGGHTRSPGAQDGDPLANALISAIISLEPFNRFVLVMAVLEGYSVRECAALLGRTAQEVTAAKSHALKRLGSLTAAQPAASGDRAISWSSFLAPRELA